MSKLKSVVASAMNAKTINKKASNLLVDNFKIDKTQTSTYGDSNYVISRFKEKYPTITAGDINDLEGIMEWDIATTWTGLGFKFEPYINYINLSGRATIWFTDEEDEETYTEEEIDIDTKEYTIKIEYNKTEEDEAVIEFKNMEIDLTRKEIKIYFNV